MVSFAFDRSKVAALGRRVSRNAEMVSQYTLELSNFSAAGCPPVDRLLPRSVCSYWYGPGGVLPRLQAWVSRSVQFFQILTVISARCLGIVHVLLAVVT